MLTGFIGGQCKKCGTLQFPKSKVFVNPNCNAFHTQEDHPFADTPSKVQSYTADRLTYSPDPPHYYGMIVFEQGGRRHDRLHGCRCGGAVDVAAPMRMMFRIKDYDPQRDSRGTIGKLRRPISKGSRVGSWNIAAAICSVNPISH